MSLSVRRSVRLLAVAVPLSLGALATVAANRPQVMASAATEKVVANGVRLRASLGQRRLVIEDGGQVVREFGIAIGLPSHPTPRGQFTVRKMIWNPGWVPPKNREWARVKKARDPGDPSSKVQTVKIFYR